MSEPAPPQFGDYYREIYAYGMGGVKPSLPIDWRELERRAAEKVDPSAYAYIWAGAGVGDTMRANREAFDRRRIVPRMLRDVAHRDLGTTVLGTEMPAPVMLAPIGVQSLVHEDGELHSARAAAGLGVPVIASTAASCTLEQIAEACGDGPRWYQLYWPNDDEIARSLVTRAEQAGYTAIVVTLDTYIPGWKPLDLQDANLPFLKGIGNQNFLEDPVFRAGLERPPEEDPGAAIGRYLGVYVNPSLSWDDLGKLRAMTSLPILLKGILHAEDALEARRAGVDGIVCSNHGGRQVDGAIASLDALPAIVDAVGGDLAILLDSGVRGGADVFKALALGADAVLLGRPYIWGLALDGEPGVRHVLRCVLAELDLTMGLSGLTDVASVTSAALARAA